MEQPPTPAPDTKTDRSVFDPRPAILNLRAFQLGGHLRPPGHRRPDHPQSATLSSNNESVAEDRLYHHLPCTTRVERHRSPTAVIRQSSAGASDVPAQTSGRYRSRCIARHQLILRCATSRSSVIDSIARCALAKSFRQASHTPPVFHADIAVFHKVDPADSVTRPS